jgi:hypothetical protein
VSGKDIGETKGGWEGGGRDWMEFRRLILEELVMGVVGVRGSERR